MPDEQVEQKADTQSRPFAVIGKVEDLYPGWRRAITVGDTTVLVNVETDGVHAIADQCPHYEVSLHTGRRRGDYIECPWHHWLIDIRTGECMHNPRIRNQTFEVVNRNGEWVVFGDAVADPPEDRLSASTQLAHNTGDSAARTGRNGSHSGPEFAPPIASEGDPA
jgi:nitrite reductase/ring-hydroxylating ferredoxin subunit